jgi:phospholipid N-methyltransferase
MNAECLAVLQDLDEPDTIGRATYSPEDNKIRIYPEARLAPELYARVKAAGFGWAPKQKTFVAPMWTPSRADLAAELCGELGDEDTTLAERAEERADRFAEYSDKRADDATRARDHVAEMSGGIPFGQPVLIGHHSQRRAERDAAKIQNGMRYAVKMWETSQYWTDRAAGALAHAKYKELPAVRARRIKGIEADKRKQERTRTEAAGQLALWTKDGLTLEQAWHIANYGGSMRLIVSRDNADGTRKDSVYGGWSAYDVLQPDGERYAACPACTVEQCQDAARRAFPKTIAWCDRWIAHYTNRLAYERAMLDEQGGTDLLLPKPRSKDAALPLCNYSVATGLDIPNMYRRGEMVHYPMHHMTKAEFAAINKDYKGTRVVGNSHRVRTAMIRSSEARKNDPNGLGAHGMVLCVVFLTDSKVNEPPEARDPEPPKHDGAEAIRSAEAYRERAIARQEQEEKDADFKAMRDGLRTGQTVQVVSAPQLFPTPPELAARMVEEAGPFEGARWLEPSAGTGNLIEAIIAADCGGHLVAVEINAALDRALFAKYGESFAPHSVEGIGRDFLECDTLGLFDRIIMNPPFQNGDDIKHIKHAVSMLAPGGRLVALCANGPRQRDQLRPLCQLWEDLPAGTFAAQGTMVNVALLIIEG